MTLIRANNYNYIQYKEQPIELWGVAIGILNCMRIGPSQCILIQLHRFRSF